MSKALGSSMSRRKRRQAMGKAKSKQTHKIRSINQREMIPLMKGRSSIITMPEGINEYGECNG